MNKFKHGDYIYFKSANSYDMLNCYYGRVVEPDTREKIMIPNNTYLLEDCFKVNSKTGEIDYSVKYPSRFMYCNKEECDTTYEGLKKILQDNWNYEVKRYCDEIETIEDLIRFPLEHCFNGDEYTDWQAMEAYKIRAKDFIEIDI